ncbi:metallophosphoesterase [Vibrio breoganii]|uniref:metallophosphoesterase family protein n=1 Tax=Vibrio breoganii TaxID=553239 RepID=UPI000C846490|nr:metallophosphoesterase [Vibrio breoganii]PML19612.1 hypothetical protein BCT84_18225 [Vibrio breoganii]
MKTHFGLISDLHLEESKILYTKRSTRHLVSSCISLPDTPNGVDVVLIAGDACEVRYEDLWRLILDKYSAEAELVVVVPGNHESWRSEYTKSLDQLREYGSRYPNVVVLCGDEVSFNDVTIFGATGWCNFGHDEYLMTQMTASYPDSSLGHIPFDCRRIKLKVNGIYRKLPATRIYQENKKAVKDIGQFLLANVSNKKVVVTHHVPFDDLCDGGESYDSVGLDRNLIAKQESLVMAYGHQHGLRGVSYLGSVPCYKNPRGNFEAETVGRYQMMEFFL